MTAAASRPPCDLVDIIDLKWLLAGDGHRLHVERLLADDDYARSCLAQATRSANPATRLAAQRIAARLGLDLPAA
jgi:hypothetical protein